MNEQIYNLLEAKGYKFKSRPNKNAAEFKSFADAFNASMDIENSFIKVSAEQDDKWLYFGEQKVLPEDPEIGVWIEIEEANEDDNEYKDEFRNVDFDSIMFSLSFGLSSFNIETKNKFSKNRVVFKGNPEEIIKFFYDKYSKHLDIVSVIKKKDRVIFKKT